ncbi:ArnT family glycosyltransferase [Saccharopolyspora taberi]|uniref:Glycosyltransferase family 39 protein n=1 Tax=Saccharopolyspora taberi TaxID=60895 RepID=A0ABN3VDP6_9PSEU
MQTITDTGPRTGDVPALARVPVWTIAGAVGVVLLATSAFGGYWFDELYFVAAGRHLAWGYADQPWLVPWLAAGLDALMPDSPFLLRVPAVLSAVGGVVLTARIARELGGERRAQVLAAGAYAVSPWLVASAHWLATYTLDPFWWLLIGWLVVRWTRVRDDRLLLWAGIATALALQTKFLVPLLWIALAAGILISGPRALLTRPLLWAGAGIAVLVTLPTLGWQVANGWPYLEFTKVVGSEAKRLDIITGLPVQAGLVGIVFIGYALWRLLRSEQLRPYRYLAWTFIGVTVLCVLLDGRAYYTSGLYGVLFAVASVELGRRNLVRWWQFVAWPGYVLSAAGTAGLLAVLVSSGAITARSTIEPVAAAYRSLSPQQRAETAIVAEIYPTAATLDHYADELGLPRAYSPHRGYWFFGPPPETATDLLYITAGEVDRMRPHFARSRPLDEPSGLWLMEDRTEPWPVIWPRVRAGLSVN